MYQSSIHTPFILLSIFVLIVVITITNANRNLLTSTSDSGVCFYGKTAERVLSILSTGKYRSLLPSEQKNQDCSDLDRKHYRSGVYKIYPAGGAGFKAYCDMKTDGGGWTVFQRRQDGKVDFYRGWEEYVNGFGNLKTEFWLGNDKLYKLTSKGHYELRVNLEDFNGDKAYAKYSTFYIGDKSAKYRLTVNGYSGTAGDSLKRHDKQAFSTKDRDNDSHSSDCAEVYKGAWWYKDCHDANLNGLYLGNKKDYKGMRWSHWKGKQSMKTTSMMIRRV
ncbi:ryncolin-1-like isoform X1 [Mytilus californianus]|uniref:ryncolin-1-like isoform X1 n=1 Tax=Mytilus californianus TaxID=6549 RepID=UPI0022464742|nr:ryncolin-1-like isoform X1 [Mytilus californianus]